MGSMPAMPASAMQAAKYRARGAAEARTLGLTRYVIGRTTGDRAVSTQLNPEARYFSVPETLRAAFYSNEWTLGACQPHSVLVSQGHYPIKGLHFVLRALPSIVDRHPDTQLFRNRYGRFNQFKRCAYQHTHTGKAHLTGNLQVTL